LSFAVLRATVRAALLRPSVLLLFGRAEVWRFDFGVDIGISSSIERRPSPPPPKPHLGHEPAGQDPEARLSPGIECSTAPIAQKSQFFLDNVIAGLSQSCDS
jgi:hypothetical protein